MKQKLYLERLANDSYTDDHQQIFVTLETYIVLFVLQYVDQPSTIEVHFIKSKNSVEKPSMAEPQIEIDPTAFNSKSQTYDEYKSMEIGGNCNFPVMVSDQGVVVAGLCGVCRAIVKGANETLVYLLGFKGSCLLAPSEASIWTKFCEIDIVKCTKSVLMMRKRLSEMVGESDDMLLTATLPNEFARFESHMGQPIRMHNIYKFARTLATENSRKESVSGEDLGDVSKINKDLCVLSLDNDSSKKNRKESKRVQIASNVPIKDLNLEHKFAEGHQISIADVILFPCFWLMRTVHEKLTTKPLEQLLPLTYKWLEAVKHDNHRIAKCLTFIRSTSPILALGEHQKPIAYQIENVEKYSLYKSDPKRYKPSNRIFTKQPDIEVSLNKINQLGVDITSNAAKCGHNFVNDEFDWASIPFEALPEGGELPPSRLQRKKEQLTSLATEIIRIANAGDRIVDFCSGAGHLGIILAYKLPQCTIYLLENKEESLMRAKQRVQRLQLLNVKFFQCNLDYFTGDFEIGTSLHACGVATDIVLMQCIDRRAKFVCCPCCYGGCNQMPHISYPRSEFFRTNDITPVDYLRIAHCADQAHDLKKTNNVEKSVQGQYCMDVVDTDRKMHAEECGYAVTLTRLQPEDCTPKNRLLIGIV